MWLCVLQCDGLKMELQELQVMYDSSQKERTELEEELQRCKAELEKLAQVSSRHHRVSAAGKGARLAFRDSCRNLKT